MSSADNCGHWLTAFSFACLIACRSDSPMERLPGAPAAASARVKALATSCAGLGQALDLITASGISGRPLLVLVDAVHASAVCDRPVIATRGGSSARVLARARYMAGDGGALDQIPAGTIEPALALRRAEMLEELKRPDDARRELALVLALSADEGALGHHQLLAVAAVAQRNDLPALGRLIAAAPIADRHRLAHRAAREVRADLVTTLPEGGPELALAAAELLEETGGPAASIAPRERLVALLPDDADAWDGLARSRVATGRIDDAIAAWDRAIALAPAQPAFRIAPIQALKSAGDEGRARERAQQLADDARASNDVELLVAASTGAAVVDQVLALALAQEAMKLRPTDGRLAFLVAQRLAEAGDKAAAGRAYVALLVCGAHGRAWHRHEVAAKLQELGHDGRTALDDKIPCEAVDAADLATYLTTLRAVH